MTKRQIDRLLESAVAEALGVSTPRRRSTAAETRGRAAGQRRTRRSRVLETA